MVTGQWLLTIDKCIYLGTLKICLYNLIVDLPVKTKTEKYFTFIKQMNVPVLFITYITI